jgi:NADPH2:quinone reductase
VGHVAIQLAKWLGAKVFATCSSDKKMEIAKQLGADVLINYKKESIESYIKKYTQDLGFDVVFDTVGGNNLSECMKTAALFGKIVSILAAGNFDLTPAFLKGLTIHTVLQPLPLITGIKRNHYQKILTTIAKLADNGVIRPLIDSNQFTIQQVGNAHAHLEKGHAVGKVVLTHF